MTITAVSGERIRDILSRPGTRAFLIAGIALVMIIPLLLVQDLIEERMERHQAVVDEIARDWGQRQVITGPVLIAPIGKGVASSTSSGGGNPWIQTTEGPASRGRYAVILPDELEIDASLPHQVRHRSIYDAVIYRAAISINAKFAAMDMAGSGTIADGRFEGIDWNRAEIVLGISDTTAIRSIEEATFAGESLDFGPGTGTVGAYGEGVHAALDGFDPAAGALEFSFRGEINGSDAFAMSPVGKTTRLRVDSDWPHPSFFGAFLPARHEMSEDGFVAEWEVPHLARSFPQFWIIGSGDDKPNYRPAEFASGVLIYQPVDLYQLTTRAAKYGLLFIGLTLLTFFVLECVTGRSLHIVQYGVITGGLVLFFALLLSLAEHIGFTAAYVAAAAAEIVVVVLYTAATLGDRRQAAIAAAVLTALYVILYFILKAQDFALLAGSLLLFAALVATMYATRHLGQAAATRAVDESAGDPA